MEQNGAGAKSDNPQAKAEWKSCSYSLDSHWILGLCNKWVCEI